MKISQSKTHFGISIHFSHMGWTAPIVSPRTPPSRCSCICPRSLSLAAVPHRAIRARPVDSLLLHSPSRIMSTRFRDLLARALGAGGFHPTSDIEAITVNRWSHGYSYEYTELLGPAGGSPEFATFPGPPLDKIGLKPLSPPNISSLGLCNSSREETMVPAMEMPKKSLTSTRGFASMDREKQLAIARKGGESVPNEKRSFSQNRRLAAEAGRKGGQSVNPTKRSFSRNHALASEAGRKGGHASHPGPKIAGDQE